MLSRGSVVAAEPTWLVPSGWGHYFDKGMNSLTLIIWGTATNVSGDSDVLAITIWAGEQDVNADANLLGKSAGTGENNDTMDYTLWGQ